MTLEPAGVNTIARALSGHVGVLCGDTEAEGLGRQPATFDDGPVQLRFGPARRATRVTGLAVFRDGGCVLTERLPEPLRLAPGQSLEVTVSVEATGG